MAFTSAISNQVARSVNSRVSGVISKGLKDVFGTNGGSNSSDTRALAANGGATTKNFQYPLNVEGDEQQGHYIMFMINTAQQPKIGKGKGGAPATPSSNQQQNGPSKTNQEAFRSGSGGNTLSAKRPPSTRLDTAISLYMPPSVTVAYKAEYVDDEIGGMAEAGVKAGNKIIEAFSSGGIKSAMKEGASQITGTVLPAVGQVAGQAVLGMMDKVAQGSGTLVQLQSGVVFGSKFELLFKNIGRRQFSFSFNFLPKSEQEVIMVAQICDTFKRHMMPSVAESMNVGSISLKQPKGRLLTIPDTFDIQYMYQSKENPFLNKISTCYLTGVDVSYGGDKYSTFEPVQHPITKGIGPAPQKTSIKLDFNEIEIMTKERIEEGY